MDHNPEELLSHVMYRPSPLVRLQSQKILDTPANLFKNESVTLRKPQAQFRIPQAY
jgi:hypothetical protein